MNPIRGYDEHQLRAMQKEIAEELNRPSVERLRNNIPMQPESVGGAIGMSGTGQALTNDEVIEHVFTFHDNPEATPHYIEVREAAKQFAKVVARHAPRCPDQALAVQHIRQAVMFANAAIALGGRGL